jgi:hypothetical protein
MRMKNQVALLMLRMLGMATVGLVLTLAAPAQDKASVPPHGKLSPLFNGKDFIGFDTLLEKHGINHDPDKVFQVEKGSVAHIGAGILAVL